MACPASSYSPNDSILGIPTRVDTSRTLCLLATFHIVATAPDGQLGAGDSKGGFTQRDLLALHVSVGCMPCVAIGGTPVQMVSIFAKMLRC